MTGRLLAGGLVVLATTAAAALVAVFVLSLGIVGPEYAVDPTDAPSGERANPCADDDRVCNEWLEVQEPDQ